MDELLAETLANVCLHLEQRLGDARVAIFTLGRDDGRIRVAAAPNLPSSLTDIANGLHLDDFDGPVAWALVNATDQIVEDLAERGPEPGVLDLFTDHDVRSMWTHPLVESDGDVVGAIAVYRPVTAHPDDDETDTVHHAGELAQAAIVALDRTHRPTLRQRVRDRTEQLADLRRGIDAGEFELWFQPVFKIDAGKFFHAEALVRWQHPTRGIVAPDDFDPLAESSGLIDSLGAKVLQLAIDQLVVWNKRGISPILSVNISAVQLANASFADFALGAIAAAGIETKFFTFEVTESALMNNFDLAHANLSRLRAAGVSILMDDFGTGYSSLARLDEMPIGGVKIDKRFIQQLTSVATAPAIVQAIVNVAKAYDMSVIAEGIEDNETLQRATDLGVHYGQGFFFARPRPPAEIEHLFSVPWSS